MPKKFADSSLLIVRTCCKITTFFPQTFLQMEQGFENTIKSLAVENENNH